MMMMTTTTTTTTTTTPPITTTITPPATTTTKTIPLSSSIISKETDDSYENKEQQLLFIKKEQLNNNNNSIDDYETMHPKLKKILKTYRSSAQKNVLGPSSQNINDLNDHHLLTNNNNNNNNTNQYNNNNLSKYSKSKHDCDFDNWSAPPPNSIIKGCGTLSADSCATEKCDTLLHGERITCFIVGGEKRLCLPEMLNFVLKEFTVQQINSACEKLHIYCSRCTNEQLDLLKQDRLLPLSAPSCGLITLTDAERLCHILLANNLSRSKKSIENNLLFANSTNNNIQLKVFHRCFGRTYGVIYPSLYTNINAQCIECETCHLFYSPQNFVVHTHRQEETRICHWGFDSSNWRLYLRLTNSYKDEQKYVQEFENFKYKYANKRKSICDDQAAIESSNQLKNSNGNNYITNACNNSVDNNSENYINHELLAKRLHKLHDSSIFNENNIKIKMSIDANNADSLNHNNNNNNNNNNNTNNTEHKLLNDLLSKPIGVSTSNNNNNNNNNNNYTPNSAIHNLQPLIYPKLLQQTYSTNNSNENSEKLYNRHIDDFDLKTIQYDSNEILKSTNLTEGIFENLRNEIEQHIEPVERKEHFFTILFRTQSICNEKLLKFAKSRFELQEMKNSLLLENEHLRSRLKYVELENQLLRTQVYNKAQQPVTVYNVQQHPTAHPSILRFYSNYPESDKINILQNIPNITTTATATTITTPSSTTTTNAASVTSTTSNNNTNSPNVSNKIDNNINSENLNDIDGNKNIPLNSIASSSPATSSISSEQNSSNSTPATHIGTNSPQQQAAAIALISLNSPPFNSTPKRNNFSKISSSSTLSLGTQYPTVNQLLIPNSLIKCETPT